MSEISLKRLASKLQGIAVKNQLGGKELEALREIKDGIAKNLQLLKECDCCGAAVLEIARLELDGVRAAVCQACGIKALKDRSLVVKRVKKKAESIRAKEVPKKSKETAIKKRPLPTQIKTATPKKKSVKKIKPVASESLQTSLDFSKPAPKPVLLDDSAKIFEEIASLTKIKTTVVRKVRKIAESVAFPMNLEQTTNYTKMELQSNRIMLEQKVLLKILKLLVDKAGLKVKR